MALWYARILAVVGVLPMRPACSGPADLFEGRCVRCFRASLSAAGPSQAVEKVEQ